MWRASPGYATMFGRKLSLPSSVHEPSLRSYWSVSGRSRLDETNEIGMSGARDSQEVCLMTTQALDTVAANDPVSSMVRLISEVARSLVDRPETVSVEPVPDGEGTILRLRVAPTDLGKVIGRQGRTARSLRTILSAASMKLKHRFSLDISEEDLAAAENAHSSDRLPHAPL